MLATKAVQAMANGVAMRAIKTQRRPAALAGAFATGGLAGATGLGVALTAVSGLGAAAPGVAVTAVSGFSGGGGLLGALGVVSDMVKTILNSGGKSERPRYSVYEAMGSFLVTRSWTVNPCVRKERGCRDSCCVSSKHQGKCNAKFRPAGKSSDS